MSRGRWGGYYNPAPRREVEGGVVVAKPGKVTDPVAVELIAAAAIEAGDKILARGRTYARAGQVVAVRSEPEAFTAQIQGTGKRPYEVRLDRTTISGSDRVAADCTCPYGCDYGWCKHAAALAYVAGFMLDRDPAVRAVWTGTDQIEPGIDEVIADTGVRPASTLVLNADDLATLRSPISKVDAAALLTAAAEIVPPPWDLPPGQSD